MAVIEKWCETCRKVTLNTHEGKCVFCKGSGKPMGLSEEKMMERIHQLELEIRNLPGLNFSIS